MFRRRRGYRRVVPTTSFEVSPGEEANINQEENAEKDRSRYASEVSSSLSLQILIYYNGLASAAYFFLEGGLVVDKLRNYNFRSSLQKFILGPVFVIWAATEMLRVYLGYKGNINEMVPHMCAFLLTTLFPQTFCLIFFSFFQEHLFPIDSIIGSIQVLFLVCELVLGYYGTKAIINKRTAQFFRVAQEDFLARSQGVDHPRAL